MSSTLAQSLAGWDGKSAADITAVYECYCMKSNFIDDLISSLGAEQLQAAASWCLKHALEQDMTLDYAQRRKLFALINQLQDWQSRLHLLQSLPRLDIPAQQTGKLEAFIRDNLTDSNTFVRAWSYNAFHVLASQYPQCRDEAKAILAMGMRDEPASVKARIRNIDKTAW